MSNYVKGRRAENYIKQKLIKSGFPKDCVIRCAQSKPYDLVVFGSIICFVLEIKAYELSDTEFIKTYTKLKEQLRNTQYAVPIVIYKEGRHYVSKPYDIFKFSRFETMRRE